MKQKLIAALMIQPLVELLPARLRVHVHINPNIASNKTQLINVLRNQNPIVIKMGNVVCAIGIQAGLKIMIL